jgi:hypothetical protein
MGEATKASADVLKDVLKRPQSLAKSQDIAKLPDLLGAGER